MKLSAPSIKKMPVVQLCEFLKKEVSDVTFVPVTNCQSLFFMINLLGTFLAYENGKRVFVCTCNRDHQKFFLKDIIRALHEIKSETVKELSGEIFDKLYSRGHDPTQVHERIVLTPTYVFVLGSAFKSP